MNFDIRKVGLILSACAALGASHAVRAQSSYDEQQQLIAQIQTDKRAFVLTSLELDNAQVQAFTPIYDRYQFERKELFDRAADLLDLYATNYDSMSADVARRILKDWFALQNDEVALARTYAKQFAKVLPYAKVIRFVQVANKVDTLLQLKVVANVPLAR